MIKEYGKPLLVFIIVLAITFLAFITVNNSLSVYESGQVLNITDEDQIYSLVGYSKDTNTGKYYFDIVVEDTNIQLSLIYGFIPEDIKINGSILIHSANYNSSKFHSVTIDSGLFDMQTNSVTLEFNSKDNPYNQPVYLTTVTGAKNGISAYDTIFAFNIGMTFLISLYGASLYFHKPSEKYLVWFSLYTGAITLWSVGSILLDTNSILIKHLVSHAYGWSALLDIIICIKIFKTKLPGRLDKLLSSRGVLGILFIWALFETFTPNTFRDYSYLFFFSIGALIYACAKHRKGAWMLLLGQTISLGMRLVVTFSPINTMQVGYWMRVMRYSKSFNIPFVICCLLLINRLFAEKFSESEDLAAELEQSNQMLEVKVAERTKELKNQQRQRSTFMMNIFHDLRTPLFVLNGCVERINSDPEKINQELPVIMERLDFTQHLVEDLFLMAKLEDNKLILETERVPLGELLDKVIKSCLLVSEKKEVLLEYKKYNDCVTWGDEYRLEQAFQNIIVNAIYYTKPKGNVYIDLKSIENMAYVTITDTGVGISEEDLDKIFDRYYRVSGTEKHQSTGLGLSIAQEILKQHQGSIAVKSELGKGTVFTVQLPVIS
ncbi:sensor histidine kinase [Sedimentibacter sp. MB31-C6]|uniref:sensor histidine kinase n=1 Tax=Sedimentibacter sp. MB31-C6 TaxID=3109366 RepID=UPI002DDCD4B6|nr:ATP-binding protein [Sedimentibacter sp. MB36-C1]WSI05238.1 ATP-binding protein [Sedimentibacter sp. MB36-C1]